MGPELPILWDLNLSFTITWVCLEMDLEGIKCGYAIMRAVPWGYLFQGWLL